MKLDFDETKFSCKYDYCIGKATDLADPTLHGRAQEYRRRLSGAMKSLSGQDIYKIPKTKGFYATRKYDGEFPKKHIDSYLRYYDMTRPEFDAVLDVWANKTLFEKLDGRWTPTFNPY